MATRNAVAKLHTEVTIGTLFDEIQRAVDSICRRAYEFAAERGFATGHDLGDWLKAENELFFVPPADLKETETHYILTAPVAGFKPEQIAVSVDPKCVTVWGKAPTTAKSKAGSRELFCQYRLPHAVLVESAKATYASEELTVTLPKRSEPQEADVDQPAAA
jgi:HSP20 family molecular chaperone IbpA